MTNAISFDAAPVPVREDIAHAHRVFWDRLAAAGTWWTGAERIAIAAEAREAGGCKLCEERRAAVSPYAIEGQHDFAEGNDRVLRDVAIDAVHRITTDASRLTRSWLEEAATAGLDDAHYVELLGIVVAVISIDFVCRGLGVPLHDLPEPMSGQPSRLRPAAAVLDDAWVPMLPNAKPGGAEADLWGPRAGNVIRAMSLVPESVRDLKTLSEAHYLAMDDVLNPAVRRSLSRSQIELVAGRVSAMNECFY